VAGIRPCGGPANPIKADVLSQSLATRWLPAAAHKILSPIDSTTPASSDS